MKIPRNLIAFDQDGLIPDLILENIVCAAVRGLMTPTGRKLVLYPDRRTGRVDESGLRDIERIKKSDGITLEDLIRQYVGVTASRQRGASRPLKNNKLKTEKSANLSPLSWDTNSTNSARIRDSCLVCGRSLQGKRKDAKFCGQTCRQRHGRAAR